LDEILKAAILGVVQGVTEFLPVSSSGHLALGRALLKFGEGGAFFDVFVHLGTLAAVLVFTRRELAAVLRGCAKVISGAARGSLGAIAGNADVHLLRLVLVACVPTAVLGLAMEIAFRRLNEGDPRFLLYVVGPAFMATGALLLSTRRLHFSAGKLKKAANAGLLDAFAVGLAQGLAAAPGLSRSGLTIAAGLFRAFEPAFAARFSFLICIPAIVGAALLRFVQALHAGEGLNWVALVCGAVAAGLVGYACLVFLVALVRRGRLAAFAWYLFPLGAATIGIGLKLAGVV